MVETRDFVYIHIPKTGGKSAIDFIMNHARCIGDNKPKGKMRVISHHTHCDNNNFPNDHSELRKYHYLKHGKIKDNPAVIGNKPIYATIRNPFSWYVSWYHHNKMNYYEKVRHSLSIQLKTIKPSQMHTDAAKLSFKEWFSKIQKSETNDIGAYTNMVLGFCLIGRQYDNLSKNNISFIFASKNCVNQFFKLENIGKFKQSLAPEFIAISNISSSSSANLLYTDSNS